MSKRKRSKLRRSFPKRFASDNIQGKRGPSKSAIPEKYEGIADYRQRGKTISFEDDPLFKFFKFPSKTYTKEEVAERNKLDPIPVMPGTGYQILEAEDQSPPVFRVAELLDKWQSARLNGFNEFKYYTVLFKHNEATLKLFHCGLKRCFVKELTHITIRSIIYDTMEEAMCAFNTGKISWYEALK